MSSEALSTLLAALQPATLAHMVVDLQELQQDWQRYPDEAPAESDRQALAELLAEIMQLGMARSGSGAPDFRQLIEQAKDERQADDWSRARDRQEQDNWLNDFD